MFLLASENRILDNVPNSIQVTRIKKNMASKFNTIDVEDITNLRIELFANRID